MRKLDAPAVAGHDVDVEATPRRLSHRPQRFSAAGVRHSRPPSGSVVPAEASPLQLLRFLGAPSRAGNVERAGSYPPIRSLQIFPLVPPKRRHRRDPAGRPSSNQMGLERSASDEARGAAQGLARSRRDVVRSWTATASPCAPPGRSARAPTRAHEDVNASRSPAGRESASEMQMATQITFRISIFVAPSEGPVGTL